MVSEISKTRDLLHRYIKMQLSERGIMNIGPSHGQILNVVYSNDKLYMTEISGFIGKKLNTVTALIDKLDRLDYIKKKRDSGDRRRFAVSITEKGKALRCIFNDIYEEMDKTILRDISDRDVDVLFNVLPEIFHRLENEYD